jgi:hypothetical protein
MEENKTTLRPLWLWLFISFILPVVGIILGILYRRKDAPESKDFGKKTTVAAILGVLGCVIFYIVWFAVLGAAKIM